MANPEWYDALMHYLEEHTEDLKALGRKDAQTCLSTGKRLKDSERTRQRQVNADREPKKTRSAEFVALTPRARTKRLKEELASPSNVAPPGDLTCIAKLTDTSVQTVRGLAALQMARRRQQKKEARAGTRGGWAAFLWRVSCPFL